MSRATIVTVASQTPVYGTLDFTARDTRSEFIQPGRGRKRARSESPPPSASGATDYTFPNGYFTSTGTGTPTESTPPSSIQAPPADAPDAPRRSFWAWFKGLRLLCC